MFIAVLVIICCALVISTGLVLSSILYDIRDDINYTKGCVDETNRELPYNQWFVNAYMNLNKKLDDVNDHLITEIACLATKNNEDIKRMGGKFEEWDLIEVEGKEFVIVKNYTNSNGDSMVSCMGSNGQTYNYYKGRLADAKFIRHIESPFDEREV